LLHQHLVWRGGTPTSTTSPLFLNFSWSLKTPLHRSPNSQRALAVFLLPTFELHEERDDGDQSDLERFRVGICFNAPPTWELELSKRRAVPIIESLSRTPSSSSPFPRGYTNACLFNLGPFTCRCIYRSVTGPVSQHYPPGKKRRAETTRDTRPHVIQAQPHPWPSAIQRSIEWRPPESVLASLRLC